ALGGVGRELLDAEGHEDHDHHPAQDAQHAIGSGAAFRDSETRWNRRHRLPFSCPPRVEIRAGPNFGYVGATGLGANAAGRRIAGQPTIMKWPRRAATGLSRVSCQASTATLAARRPSFRMRASA